MPHISVRCYAELNDFLPDTLRFRTYSLSLPEGVQIRNLPERIGVPLQAIDLILANGEPADPTYVPKDNDRISLYPVFESFDISPIAKLRERPLRNLRFVADVHLGKLARYLRMIGFDTLYRNNTSYADLLSSSIEQERILLSRNRSLLENESLSRAYLIMNSDPRRQLIDVLDRFDLYRSIKPFSRCILCNSLLQAVEKHIVFSQIPVKVAAWCGECQRCVSCGRIYWKGSHHARMQALIVDILHHHINKNGSSEKG